MTVQTWCLYVPGSPDTGPSCLGPFVGILRELNLTSVVSLTAEDSDEIINYLKAYVDPSAKEAVPYLEQAIGGSSAVVLYFVGDDIAVALSELAGSQVRVNRGASGLDALCSRHSFAREHETHRTSPFTSSK